MLSSHSGANMPETKCHPWANMHGTMSSRGIYAWTQRAVLNPETQCFLIILHNATPVKNMYNSDRYSQHKLLTFNANL